MNLTAILAMICALMFAGCVTLYQFWSAADTRADQAEIALQTVADNQVVEKIYVDKIVNVPGPTVIRDRLVRGVCHTIPLPGVADAAGAAPADPTDRLPDRAGRFYGRLSGELRNVAINHAKLDAVRAELLPQLD